jgi:DNA-binding XRE family transcriptional regulator
VEKRDGDESQRRIGGSEGKSYRRARVEGLRQLRQLAGKGQADIASALNIKQPSVSKIEKQTDMYLSTLRSYVEAVGGETGIDYQAAAAARAAYPYSR